MHREVDSDQASAADFIRVDPVKRKVNRADVIPSRSQHCGGFGQSERLAPEFVSRNKDGVHRPEKMSYVDARSSTSARVGGEVTRLTTIRVVIDNARAG